jgi:hypothetical protein
MPYALLSFNINNSFAAKKKRQIYVQYENGVK